MNVAQEFSLLAWYWLRRRTRKYRNRSALEAFNTAVKSLKPGDVCIDCGANIGNITRRLAATGATVHAFEPNPDAFEVLASSVQSLPNVVLHRAAVGVGSGYVNLYLGWRSGIRPPTWGGATTVQGKANLDGEDFTVVEQVDFGSFLQSIDEPIAILKIDIEGGELELLSYLLDNGLQARALHIFVETHEKQFLLHRRQFMELTRRCDRFGNINLDWW